VQPAKKENQYSIVKEREKPVMDFALFFRNFSQIMVN